jgi:hypothetical protein
MNAFMQEFAKAAREAPRLYFAPLVWVARKIKRLAQTAR